MLSNRSYLKFWLTLLTGSIIFAIIIIDFADPFYYKWSRFQQTDFPTPIEVYGAKAALLAVAGAAILFIALIPVDTSPRSKMINLLAGLVGILAATSTGWFWLLNASNGKPTPYLIAFIPFIGLILVAMMISMAFWYTDEMDEKQLRETGTAKLKWKGVIIAFTSTLALALVLFGIAYLPDRLF